MKQHRKNTIGLIPAAGKASRMKHLPFSKELYPIGVQSFGKDGQIPKVIAMHLIDTMKKAGIQDFYTVIRKEKWDIPAYFNNGHLFDINMAYLMADKPYGVPYTLNQVYPFASDKTIVMGFPDIIFHPENAYVKILNKIEAKPQIDVLLGLFPVADPSKWDVVILDRNQEITAIHIKNKMAGNTGMAWIMASWKNRFSEFLNSYIESYVNNYALDSKNELQLSTIFLAAMNSGLTVSTVKFNNGYCVDLGTLEGLGTYFEVSKKQNHT